MSHTVEFFYGIGSRYSYLAATRIAALEAETGCTVRWRPIRSADLIVANGADPFDGGEVSGQYGWPYRRHDAENWAEYYGVPYLEPDFDNYDPRDLARACGAADRMGAMHRSATACSGRSLSMAARLIGRGWCRLPKRRNSILGCSTRPWMTPPSTTTWPPPWPRLTGAAPSACRSSSLASTCSGATTAWSCCATSCCRISPPTAGFPWRRAGGGR
jgi:hypothetical protein